MGVVLAAQGQGGGSGVLVGKERAKWEGWLWFREPLGLRDGVVGEVGTVIGGVSTLWPLLFSLLLIGGDVSNDTPPPDDDDGY